MKLMTVTRLKTLGSQRSTLDLKRRSPMARGCPGSGQVISASARTARPPSGLTTHKWQVPASLVRWMVKGAIREQRTHGPEVEVPDMCRAHFVRQQVQQQGGGQRTVDNQARIALDVAAVVDIVVDAVAVEGEGGVPEEQQGGGAYGAFHIGTWYPPSPAPEARPFAPGTGSSR